MRIAIVGAGAIGGYLGTKLALAGEDVTLIARGSNLAALKKNGLTLIEEDGTEFHAENVKSVEAMSEAGPQDSVLLTVKAHQVAPIAGDLHHLYDAYDAGTSVVTMQNGIPWWYFWRHGGALEGTRLETVDPGGEIARHIDPARVIGSVVYPAAVLTKPGVVEVVEGNRFGLGEPSGEITDRVKALSQSLTKAGFKAPVTSDIRGDIWLKLWGNLSFNPISALTHATLVDICQFPPTRTLAEEMMEEAQAIANKLGVTFKLGIDKRIAGAEKIGAHKTSMLQDVEAGRPIELEALVGSVVELARLTGTEIPRIDAAYALMRLLVQTLDESRGRLQIEPRA
jgi:2-dehydropantoate 2-reductase